MLRSYCALVLQSSVKRLNAFLKNLEGSINFSFLVGRSIFSLNEQRQSDILGSGYRLVAHQDNGNSFHFAEYSQIEENRLTKFNLDLSEENLTPGGFSQSIRVCCMTEIFHVFLANHILFSSLVHFYNFLEFCFVF